nr:DUF2586 family protein [Deinococcus sp. 6GRE01]
MKIKFEDYQLGLTPPVSDAHAKIGVAASGPLTPQRLTRGTQAQETYVGGPLAGAAAVALLESSPVVCVRVPTTVAGTRGAVTRTGVPAGSSVMSVDGDPSDSHRVSVRVTRPGTVAAGDAAVIVTVNGEDAPERAVPVNGVLSIPGTGMTVTFAAGDLLAGNTYAFSSTAPAATVADMIGALEALLSTRPDLRYLHLIGVATPTLAAAVDAVLTERQTRNYYTHALLEARPIGDGETMSDYLAAIETQFANFTSTRVSIALDGGQTYNPLTRRMEARSSAWKLAARRAAVPIGEAAYRVRTGPHVAMGELAFNAALIGSAGRFAALWTLDGREGIFTAAWPTMAPSGSDFGEVQRREVIDRAAQIGYIAALDYFGDSIPVDTTTGRILESKALAMETFIEGRVRTGIGSNASGIRVRVNREENILSTEHIEFALSVIPLGYMKHVTVNVSFVNPLLAALTPAAPVTPATGGS